MPPQVNANLVTREKRSQDTNHIRPIGTDLNSPAPAVTARLDVPVDVVSGCASAQGLQSATFTGTYQLLNLDTKDRQAPKTQPKTCKEANPSQDEAKETTGKRACPTAKK